MIQEGHCRRAARARQGHPRRHVRQHRHCLRDDWRRHGLQRHAVRAGERDAGAQAHPARLRRRADLHQPARGLRRRHSHGAADERRRRPSSTSTPTSTTTTSTGGRTTTPPGPEIIRQTGGALTHFVAGLGTSGTFVGAGRRLRELNRGIVLASVQPDSPLHGLEGLKHMESAIVPGIYDPALADEDVRVGTEEAYDMTRRLAQEEGLLVGISSGANLAGALKVARARRGDGGGVLRRRRALPVGALLGEPPEGALDLRHELMPIVLTDGSGRRHSRARPRDVSARMLRRAARPRRRRAGSVRAAEHHRRRPAAALPGAGPTTTAAPRSARAKPGSTCSASITRIRIIRRGRRSTTSITRGRRSRT